MSYANPVAYGEVNGYYVGDCPPYPHYGWWQYPPTYYSYPIPVQQGWECPRCHFIYGPAQLVCSSCNSEQELKNILAKEENGS